MILLVILLCAIIVAIFVSIYIYSFEFKRFVKSVGAYLLVVFGISVLLTGVIYAIIGIVKLLQLLFA